MRLFICTCMYITISYHFALLQVCQNCKKKKVSEIVIINFYNK